VEAEPTARPVDRKVRHAATTVVAVPRQKGIRDQRSRCSEYAPRGIGLATSRSTGFCCMRSLRSIQRSVATRRQRRNDFYNRE